MTGSGAASLVLGTRGSRLALIQSEAVAATLRAAVPRLEVCVRTISTEGDRVQSIVPDALPSWGLGVFVRDIEAALLSGEIDFAVHSLKDLPAALPEGLVIASVPERANPLDVLVTSAGLTLDDLPTGARVGTSSLRRAAFLRAYRPDLRAVPVRGNVDTRWRKLLDPSQGFDALVLAAAGLDRLGLAEAPRRSISSSILPPAPGQGALGLQAREGDAVVRALRDVLNHPPTAAAVSAERRVLRDLEGGCRLPVAALGTPVGTLVAGRLHLAAAVATPDGTRVLKHEATGFVEAPETLGAAVAAHLLSLGAAGLLRESAPAEALS
ncbi:MAG TPA: hydroxymethylbilane synthase [Chloroflexota bacterium]|nr:hydroxymethylbilane synthase [Chloroflexota bacterium]